MKKILQFIVVISWTVITLTGCAKARQKELNIADPEVISAFTSGVISKETPIHVIFVKDQVPENLLNKPLPKTLFSFQPKLKGETVWVDTRTLEFTPEKTLDPGARYVATLDYSSLAKDKSAKALLSFDFQVVVQSFEVNITGLVSTKQNDPSLQVLMGKLITADVADPGEIEKILEAEFLKQKMTIQWNHAANRRDHTFWVMGIQRGEEERMLDLKWDGKPLGLTESGERRIAVPSLNTFKILSVRPIQGTEQSIEIRFSDPVEKKQNLQGLIRAAQVGAVQRFTFDLRFSQDLNSVRVYNSSKWPQEVRIIVESGIKNSQGFSLKEPFSQTIAFMMEKPQLRFMGNDGVILPTTHGVTIPFEAINLNSVMVEATQIFSNNISQFLQVNNLKGNSQLYRVGRVVWRRIIPLDWKVEKQNRWIRYGLDLTPLIENDPQGMYRIKLTFRRPHIEYTCEPTAEEQEMVQFVSLTEEGQELSNWDYFDQNYNYNSQDAYRNRKNPCHPAYYRKYNDHDITKTKNVLVSDLGLIARKEYGNRYHIIATDIKTTSPLSGVEIKLLDFQQQTVAAGKTDVQGMVTLDTDQQPFLVKAESEGQAGYLKLYDGNALSVSHFDTTGAQITKGLKGFIYGERGVWRPGDTIYLTFILLDKEKRLPEEHPVILEFIDPRGQLVKRIANKKSLNGFYSFQLTTDKDAPTGNWNTRIKVGGVAFEKAIKIETIMPNRLKIELDFAKGKEFLSEGPLKATLSSTWLHGAVARNLKAEVDAGFSSRRTAFKRYTDYVFDDPARRYIPETSKIFAGKLDDTGKALIDTNLQTKNLSPGMLTAHFKTRVYEPGGAFSTDRFDIPFHPYAQYVGIRTPKGDKARGMLLTDTDHRVDIALLDQEGNPLKSGRVQAELYKIQWRWWWEKDDESLADYVGSSSFQPILEDTIQVKDGKGSWTFQVKYPSWGRYLIRVRDLDKGHSTGKVVYIDWPGWAGRAQADSPAGATVLPLSTDKTRYQVGEEVTVNVPVGQSSRGLISLEAAGKILKQEWVESKAGMLQYRFKTTSDMTPNIYLHATLLQSHMQAGNDLPIRLYGVVPVLVEDGATHLHPVIESADVFRPETEVAVTVKERQGRGMTYTLALVDEGLLGLTRYKAPNPWLQFYRKEALATKTWDLYNLVAGAYGGSLDKLLAIGGDGSEQAKGERSANRFPPVVKFLGPFELGSNEAKSHKIMLPQYIGAVRLMVVAGQDNAFGSAEKSVFVKNPLMLLGTLPRVLGPEEEVVLPVSVFVLEEKIKKVTVKVKSSGPLRLEDRAAKTLEFPVPGDQVVDFKFKVEPAIGVARVLLEAQGGSEIIRQTMELDVRLQNTAQTDVIADLVEPEGSWKKTVTFRGYKGTNKALLEVSRIPPLDLGRRLSFLIRYPHGCIEQTTSSVFPQLYLKTLLDLSVETEDEIQRNVEAGIKRLKRFQTSSGGFAYWPGDHYADSWGSNYAGHFLLEARRSGYDLPEDMLVNWKKYQRAQANSWVGNNSSSFLTQAYRLYTLALAGTPELGAMNRLKEKRGLPSVSIWRLAAAYYLAGQPEVARMVAAGDTVVIKAYKELSGTYGSDTRDRAMILESMSILGQFSRAAGLVKEISAALTDKHWLSTQTTAYALLAMSRYAGIVDKDETLNFSYAWQGAKEQTIRSSSLIFQQELAVGGESSALISLNNHGKARLFPRIILQGIPPLGTEKTLSNGLTLKVRYLDLNGKTTSPALLLQGNDFIVEVEVANSGNRGRLDELALSHIFPSGWEIHNARLDQVSRQRSSAFDFQDIRDDRIYTYFDLRPRESKVFRYMLNASYLGKFYLPAVGVEAMYDATINGQVPGKWVEVGEP